jgi:hypothetical protein
LKQVAGDARVERDPEAGSGSGPESAADAGSGPGSHASGTQRYILRVPAGARSAFFHPVDWEEFSAVLVSFGVLIPRNGPDGRMVPEWADRKPEEVSFRIVTGAQAQFLPGGPPLASLALIGLWGNLKLRVAAIDREQRRVRMVAKASSHRAVIPTLKNEAAALTEIAGRCPAPSLLGQGELPPVETDGAQVAASDAEAPAALTVLSLSWMPGVPLAGLLWEPGPVFGSLEQALAGLVRHDRTTSLAKLGAKLAIEAEALWIEPQERENLLKIIATIDDTTPVAPSRTHGDLSPRNVLVEPGGRMSLMNWEFSRDEGLGIADLARFAVNPRYTLATGFADFLDDRAMGLLRRVQASNLPGANLPLGQLLALQFATRFIDNIRTYPRTGVRMMTLGQLIGSDWCLGDVNVES